MKYMVIWNQIRGIAKYQDIMKGLVNIMKKMRKIINFIIALCISASMLTAPIADAQALNIKTPQNAADVVDADDNDTIAVLKEKIEAVTGIGKDRQRLFLNSAELADDKTVSEYAIGEATVYIRLNNAVSATVSDAQISGSTGKVLESDTEITVKLYGGTFDNDAVAAAESFSGWFKNLPDGISAVKTSHTADEIKFKFSGTPTAVSAANMQIVIPKEFISGAAADNEVIENTNAKWNIIKGITRLTVTAAVSADGTVDESTLSAADELGQTVDNSTLTYKIEYEGTDATVYAKSETKPTAPGKYKVYITAENADCSGSCEYNFGIKSEKVKRETGLDLEAASVSYKDEYAQDKTFNPASESVFTSEGWSWNHETKTLTLDGADITGTQAGLQLPDNAKIYVKSTNKITAGADGDISFGIYGDIFDIDGDDDAVLNIEAAKGTKVYGIYSNTLKITGAQINAKAGACDDMSYGIHAMNLWITGSDVTAESTKESNGYGMVGSSIVIGEGAVVKAKGSEYAYSANSFIAESHSVTGADKFKTFVNGDYVETAEFESGKTTLITNKTGEYAEIRNGRRITIDTNTEHGTISIAKNYAEPGEQISVSYSEDSGYKLSYIKVTDANGNNVGVMNCAFIMPDSDINVTAVFAETGSHHHSGTSYVTVKFDTNGGSTISDLKLRTNQRFTGVDDPTKPGYVFTGWYLDKSCKREFNTASTVGASMTLYAGWKEDPQNRIILKIGQKTANVWGKDVVNDVAPVIRNDRTMLPARFVAEALGAQVSWNDAKREVTIRGFDKDGETVVIYLYIDSDQAFVNGKIVELESPAFIENDRTYTPIRFVFEQLGAEVDWDEDTQTVYITKE